MPSAFGKPVTTANRFGTVATPGSLTLVTTLTASASSSLSYTSFSSASYKSYRLVFNRIIPSTGGTNFNVQGSVDAGANYGALWYGGTIRANNSSLWALEVANAAQNFPASYNSNTGSVGGIYGEIMFNYGPIAGTNPAITGLLGDRNASSNAIAPNIMHAVYDNVIEVNALKFLFGTGTISSGTIKIYGLT